MKNKQAERAKRPAGPIGRVLLTLAGALLLLFSRVANFSDRLLFAGHGKVYFRLPGTSPHEYNYFPVWFVVIGVPLGLLALALTNRQFREAVRQAWREAKIAVPLVAVLLYLLMGLVPWDPTNLKPADTGTHMVFIVILGSAGFCLLLAGLYRQLGFLDAALRRFYDWLMRLPRWSFVALCCGTMFAIANAVSWGVFEHIPHIQDSISQVFQARIFASGRLWLPAPAFPDFFDYTHIINVAGSTGHPATGFNIANWPGPLGRWYSQYSFMHSLVLVPSVVIGAPWITNPILGTLTVGAVYFLGREVYDERTGRLSAALAVICPFIFDMSAEFMNHASALLFTTLFVLFYFRTLREGKPRQALAAGLFWGMVFDTRAYSATVIAAPFAAYSVYRMVKEPGRLIPRFLVMIVAGGVMASLGLYYNYLTNGHPFLFGYVVKWGRGHEVGFGRSGWGEQHSPLRGLINTGHDMNLLNKFLFEWPLPALLPIGITFAAGTRDKRDWLLLSVYLSLVVAFYFYWFHNVCFGPRFLYEAAGCLCILTARGALSLPGLLRRTFARQSSDEAVFRFEGRALVLLLLGFLLSVPGLLKSYEFYGWVNGKLARSVRREHLSNALVFCTQFGSGYSANRLDLQGNVVYAKNNRILNSALTLAYPDRQYYYANQDTLRPLEGIEWRNSQLRQALSEVAAGLNDSALATFRTLAWPFRDIPPPGADSALLATRLADYREISREIFSGRHQMDDYMPMLATWVLGDDREHLQIFTYMDDIESYVASGLKFTLLYVTSDGSVAVYDVRPTEGDEQVVPDRPGTLPVR